MLKDFSALNVRLNDEIVKSKLRGWINTGEKKKVQQLSEILMKFRLNIYSSQLKQRMLAKLKKTTYGGIFDSFSKWKALPDNGKNSAAKASVFERSLLKVMHVKNKREVWNPLFEIHLAA